MLLENLNKLKDFCMNFSSLYIWGASNFGMCAIDYLHSQNIMIKNIFDNDDKKVGKLIQGIEVIKFESSLFSNDQDHCIVICSSYFNEIKEQLRTYGVSNYAILPDDLIFYMDFEKYFIKNENRFNNMFIRLDEESTNVFQGIINFRRTNDSSFIKQSTYTQYFHPKVSPVKGDVIIDGGAFWGDTVESFEEALNQQCYIHSFEPAAQNFLELEKTTAKYDGVILNRMGLGETSERLKISYNEMYPAGSMVTQDGDQIVQITSIDDYVTKNNVDRIDLIKLDVEGFELPTLKGANKTIRTNRPKLQVCLYHSNEDLIDIYEYIIEQFGDLNYKFYIGHHSDVIWETVLYAISE